MATRTDRFELPDGEWAELYVANKIPESKRRVIQHSQLAMARVLPAVEIPTMEVSGPAPTDAPNPAFGAPPIAELKAQAEEAAKTAMRTFNTRDLNDGALESVDAWTDALILGFTKAWSFTDLPLVDSDGQPCYASLLELDGETYDALKTECTARNNAKAPEGGVGTAVDSPDAMIPTSP